MGYGWPRYVPVAERRAKAAKATQRLAKKGLALKPVRIEGQKIAKTFWGKAWCSNLESYSDYANRLPRGRTYVRNGSVCHLEIDSGTIRAKVSGSRLYDVTISIKALRPEEWEGIKKRSAGEIRSLLDLLGGKLSKEVMAIVTDREHGLFPKPKEIRLECSCPDWADMCKHVAAVLYGVGARLDERAGTPFHPARGQARGARLRIGERSRGIGGTRGQGKTPRRRRCGRSLRRRNGGKRGLD